MYDEDDKAELKQQYRGLLRKYDTLAGLMDSQLAVLPFPQSLGSHVSLELMTRFHKSMLAERLLLVSEFYFEAYSILCMMVEYTITLKFIRLQPEPRAGLYLENEESASWTQHTGMQLMAGETDMLEWLPIIDQRPAGPPFPVDAAELLARSCELAAMMLDSSANR